MVGMGFALLLVSIYLMKFSTDVLLIAPATMGLLFGLGRIWDAVSDPMVGFLSDRSTAARGRRRSWMLASAFPVGVTIVMLWSPPLGLSPTWLVVWMAVAMLLYETATTAFFVPYGALGMELTRLHHDRTRLFGYRQIIATLGFVLGLGAVYLLRTAEQPRSMALALSVVGGAAFAATILYAAIVVPEPVEHSGRGAVSMRKAFLDVFRNPHARLLLLVYGIETFGGASLGMLAPYAMEYVVSDSNLTEVFILMYFVPRVVSIPVWVRLSRHYGKKHLWTLAMLASSVSFFAIFFLDEGRLWLTLTIPVLLGLAGGCSSIVAPSIQADVIDFDEYLTDERKEGAYIAVWNLVRKGSGGLTAVLAGFALQFSGFEPNAPQSETTKTAILAMIGLLPGACFLVGALMFSRFRLDEAEHTRIMAVLETRNSHES